jgi:hypothetical protein
MTISTVAASLSARVTPAPTTAVLTIASDSTSCWRLSSSSATLSSRRSPAVTRRICSMSSSSVTWSKEVRSTIPERAACRAAT